MNVLIYGIIGHPHPSDLEPIKGIGDDPIFLVEGDGLTAAVSRMVPPDVTPNLKRLLQYQKIIEWFHNECTIIPMRYGCLVAEESEVVRILKNHGEEYKRLLGELEGCAEMGIRILSSASGPEGPPAQRGLPSGLEDLRAGSGPKGSSEPQASQLKSEIENKLSSYPGQAYLAARKALYDQEESINQENRTLTEEYRKVFAGLFVKCKHEGPSIRNTRSADSNRLFSLYFLVPKNSVPVFRRIFQRVPSKEGQKILLSGPWPPYNFVYASPAGRERVMIDKRTNSPN